MPTLAELLAQKAEIEQLIAETRRANREQAIAQVRELMQQNGLTLADLGDIGALSNPSAQRAARAAGAKVAAKYRHPDSGQTWSGRGLQPTWLKAALAAGRPLSDFLI